jgi:alkylhydroperoxidase family enzyme
MAWIRTIDEHEAEGDLKRIYAEQRQQAGDLANILKAHSLAPNVLKAHLGLYHAAMHAAGELSRVHREMIAVAVSAANGCDY